MDFVNFGIIRCGAAAGFHVVGAKSQLMAFAADRSAREKR